MNGYPAGVRPAPGQNGGIGWNHYHGDNFSTRAEPEKDAVSETQMSFFVHLDLKIKCKIDASRQRIS